MKVKINPKKVLEKRKSLVDTLTEEIKEQGVIQFVPVEMTDGNLNIDSKFLSMPKDLTEIPSRELGNYLNAFTQQKAYMRTLCGWQEICVEEVKRKYYDKYYTIYEQLTEENPKMSEKAKDTYCNNNDYVKESYLQYRDSQFKLGMISSTIDSLEDFIFLISREISRRTKDYSEMTREDNLR